MDEGPIEGGAEGEVEGMKGGVSWNGEGASYGGVGDVKKVYTDKVVVRFGIN